MQQQTLHKKRNESPAYLDPQIAIRTIVHLNRTEVIGYFCMAMRHYKDKEILVVPFNMGNPTSFHHIWLGLILWLFKADRSKNWWLTYPWLEWCHFLSWRVSYFFNFFFDYFLIAIYVLYVSNKFGILRVGKCNNKLFIKREMSLLHILTHKWRQELISI
jgi:hypothetical protein